MFLEKATEKQLRAIYAEFGATEESLAKDVQVLKEWMQKQPHLPSITNEDWLKNFMIRCKNSVERAKSTLDNYYTLKAYMPEIFTNRDPYDKELTSVMKEMMFVPLPKLTPEGYRVSILRIFSDLEIKATSDHSTMVIKAIFMLVDYRMKTDVIAGDVIVYDMSGMTMNVVALCLANIKKFLTLGTKGIPTRYPKIYIMNAMTGTDTLITFGKSLVKKELADRVEVIKDKDLVQYLPKEIVPSTYGGLELSMEELRDKLIAEFKENRDWFVAEEAVKADVDKRPKDAAFGAPDGFGLEGSFRKITLD